MICFRIVMRAPVMVIVEAKKIAFVFSLFM